MNTRCQIGDLAIITKTIAASDLLGKIVRVVRPAVDHEIFPSTDGASVRVNIESHGMVWVIEADRPLPWVGKLMLQRPYPDSYMTPISGIPIDDEVTDDLEVMA